MVTYKGLPAPIICDFLSREASRAHYAPGTEFQIGKIEMVANTGTYLDSPFHRYADGKDLSELPLERWPTWTASSCARIHGDGRAIDDVPPSRRRRARQGGPGPHRLGSALAHGRVFRGRTAS